MNTGRRQAGATLLLMLSPVWLLGFVVVVIALADQLVSHANLSRNLARDGISVRAIVHQTSNEDRYAWLLRFPGKNGEDHYAFLQRDHVPQARRAILREGSILRIRYLPYGDMSLVAEEDLDWLRREGGPDIRLHLILLVSFAILLSIKPDILYLGLAINRGPDSPDPEHNPADKSA